MNGAREVMDPGKPRDRFCRGDETGGVDRVAQQLSSATKVENNFRQGRLKRPARSSTNRALPTPRRT
ncbi:MAG TPA: hypothetical protein VLB69_06490 [Rudaea sp.]|nr:hypothetical protein [Rudaea sp.]